MLEKSLVSIIIPVRDREIMIETCLKRIKAQTYSNIEIIVVDGNSVDQTVPTAKKYTDKTYVFDKRGDHRCAQRNFGVDKAQGEYVLIIDSDMELSEGVVEECVQKMDGDDTVKGIKIPEESFGEGFWAQCKKLEKSFYIGVDWMEAARFYRRVDYLALGGYDVAMTSGEDWDLSQRMQRLGKIDRVNTLIHHNEGRISLLQTVKKKYYYAQKLVKYTEKSEHQESTSNQTSIIARYKMFFSQPNKLFKKPLVGIGMLFMKTAEFGVGGLGLLVNKLR